MVGGRNSNDEHYKPAVEHKDELVRLEVPKQNKILSVGEGLLEGRAPGIHCGE